MEKASWAQIIGNMFDEILGRKLLATWGAIAGICVIVIGLPAVGTELLIENKELAMVAVISIAGLGGYNTKTEADKEQNGKGG